MDYRTGLHNLVCRWCQNNLIVPDKSRQEPTLTLTLTLILILTLTLTLTLNLTLLNPGGHLIVYHLMFGADWKKGCSLCSFFCDGFDGALPHILPSASSRVTFA